VSVCVCVSVCLTARNHTRDLYQIFAHVAYAWLRLGLPQAE